MSILGYFFNAVESGGVYDRTYNAEDITDYLAGLVGNGVFPTPSNCLQVRAGTGMQVIVSAGTGWINGYKIVNTADMVLTLNASDVLLPRVDRVVFYVDYVNRCMGIDVVEGAPNNMPDAVDLQQDDNRYELSLATIDVRKQVTQINASDIYDTRFTSQCGVVQGLIQQVSTETLFNQWQSQFEEWFESVQNDFASGKRFKKLEGVFVTTGSNTKTFNVVNYVPDYSFAYDILEIYINGIHLTSNDYTISNSTVTLETPIESAGAVVDFVVYKSVDN